jgi:hypothetical protein
LWRNQHSLTFVSFNKEKKQSLAKQAKTPITKDRTMMAWLNLFMLMLYNTVEEDVAMLRNESALMM